MSTPTPKADYARKSPRTPFAGAVRVSVEGGAMIGGRFVDLSSGGACIELPFNPERGQTISLFIDTAGKARGGWTSASVVGSVAWCVPLAKVDGDGSSWHKVGVALAATAVTRRWLSELKAPEEAPERPMPVTNASRGRTPEGREALYQEALDALGGGQLEPARELARAALIGAPRASHLRALLMRIEAEQAIAEHHFDTATRRIEAGRRLAPDDRCWIALEGRASRPRGRGLLSRLFAQS